MTSPDRRSAHPARRFHQLRVRLGLALAAVALAALAVLLPLSEPFHRSYDRMTHGEVERVTPHRIPIVGEGVHAIDVRYRDAAGQSRVVRSYDASRVPAPGDTVAVLYASDGSSDACVAGHRPRPLSLGSAATLVPLVVVGVGLAASGWRRGTPDDDAAAVV